MRLRYETGIATFVQFIVVTVLSFINGLESIISGCHGGTPSDCASNSLVSLVYIILTALWFGFLWVLGYAAQDRRSSNLARILIAAEVMVTLVALFDARHFPNALGLVTSLIDAALAVWIIILALRLSHAKGGRIRAAKSPLPRRRQPAKKQA